MKLGSVIVCLISWFTSTVKQLRLFIKVTLFLGKLDLSGLPVLIVHQ